MASRRVVLLVFLPLLLAMRDPFQPAVDSCAVAQLSQWRYRGVVSSERFAIGLVMDNAGKWQRLIQGQVLENGWRIIRLSPEEIEVRAGERCESAAWRWQKEGANNHENHRRVADAAAGDSVREGKGQRRHADRR
ncbi:HofP DNA utilization family protein [[Enterobacter] lignolyticus]|uniref:HofP DNA utilization family protein n=1 Tax=[Enterobacter] lignolyticus TaxID=1334193 RepID=UPI000F6859F3|nr:HofP DNA utilization family protein [[Enterobacter] lignolyticus]